MRSKIPIFVALVLCACIFVAPSVEAKVRRVNSLSTASSPDGSSWRTAYRTIQSCLEVSAVGDECWVAKGTYFENIEMRNGVALYGGFAGGESRLVQRDWKVKATVIDGGGRDSVVVIQSCVSNLTRVDGFTIRNGLAPRNINNGGGIHADGSSFIIANNTIMNNIGHDDARGAGISAIDCPSVTIENNLVSNNNQNGIFVEGGVATISGNTVTANGAGQVVSMSGINAKFCEATITANDVHGNVANGISMVHSSGVVSGNRSHGNISPREHLDSRIGTGIVVWGPGTVTVSGNRVFENEYNGIEIMPPGEGSGVTTTDIIGNLIYRNDAWGIFSDPGNPNVFVNVYNNTIVGHTSEERGGLYTRMYNVMFFNNIVANNWFGLHQWIPAKADYNNVFGNMTNYYPMQPGENDIHDVPAFVDADADDYHITASSPCRNGGDPAIKIPASWLDMDGQARVNEGRVDVGADEYYRRRPRP